MSFETFFLSNNKNETLKIKRFQNKMRIPLKCRFHNENFKRLALRHRVKLLSLNQLALHENGLSSTSLESQDLNFAGF